MRFFIVLISILVSTINYASTQKTNINSLPKYSLKYDPARDPFKDGYAAIENAKMTQRRILIEVGGEWCSWCHMIERFLDENPDVKIALHQTFVILKVNVSDSNDNQAFLSSLPKPLGYPHMYVSEKDGTILLSKDTAELISDGQYSRQKFLEFIKYWTLENE